MPPHAALVQRQWVNSNNPETRDINSERDPIAIGRCYGLGRQAHAPMPRNLAGGGGSSDIMAARNRLMTDMGFPQPAVTRTNTNVDLEPDVSKLREAETIGHFHSCIRRRFTVLDTKPQNIRVRQQPLSATTEGEEENQVQDIAAQDAAFVRALELTPEEESSLTKRGDDEKTVIHRIVEGSHSKNAALRLPLIRYVLRMKPQLLEWADVNGKTSFHACIVDSRQALLDFMLSEPDLKQQCIGILQTQGAKGSCLHEALTQKMESCAGKMLELLESDSAAFSFVNAQGNTPLHLSVDPSIWPEWKTSEETEARVRLVEKLIKKGNKALEVANKNKQTPLQYYLYQRQKLGSNPLEGNRPTIATSESKMKLLDDGNIHFLLLDACMHLGALAYIKKVLYGSTAGKMITFDLADLGSRREPLPEDFLDRLNHIDLEQILKLVYLPTKLLVVPYQHLPTNPMVITTLSTRGDGEKTHRTGVSISYGHIFHWLQKKRVRKIIHLMVNDDEQWPTKDDEIELALRPFEVEILDWKKLEISSETILEASPDVLHLVLYTKGLRSVLWGWSAPDGLIKLNKLETIEIHVIQPIEPRQRIERYLAEFKDRVEILLRDLNNARISDSKPPREIQIHWNWDENQSARSPKKLHASNSEVGRRVEATQSWLGVMTAFNKFVCNYTGDESRHTIRIAILDDGVDIFTNDLVDRIIGGHSFCHGTYSEMGESPYFCSAKGHGTEMAKLVCQVFQRAKIIALKLDGSQSGNPTARSAAEAINWLISKNSKEKIDIISMSWSIPRTAKNEDDIYELKKAINEAHNQNILMFCSASDGGMDTSSSEIYPAKCSSKVFCIGAAKSTGQTDSKVGEQPHDFTVPGQVTTNAENESNVSITGSSASTALAAGLTGLILFCVSVSSKGEKYFGKLHKRSNMEKVLKRLAKTDHPTADQPKLLRIKEIFSAEFGNMDWDEKGSKKLEALVDRLLVDVVAEDYDDDTLQLKRAASFESF